MKKNKEGGQPGNKNAEKWTEAEALKLGNDLLAWMKEDSENIFFKEFLIIENDYYQELIDYLSNKYESFFNLIKKAKEIQELKLVKHGTAGVLNPTMTIFTLKNHHDYKDKSETDITSKGGSIIWNEIKTYATDRKTDSSD